jgi:hypothetical protein
LEKGKIDDFVISTVSELLAHRSKSCMISGLGRSDAEPPSLPPVTLPETTPPLPFPSSMPSSASTLPQPPATFPLRWLLANGSPAVRYRSLVEVAALPLSADTRIGRVPYASRQGWELLLHQHIDGTWGHGMLTVPGTVLGTKPAVGGIPGYRRLLELGWDPESAPLATARRALFRLLPEDNDPAFLYEFAKDAGSDPDLISRGRQILREAAAAALAQAGYEADPRLRGAARRIIDRMGAFLRSPAAEKPFIRVGNQHVLPLEASPPSFHTLVMLAYMPHFRSEYHDHMERLYHWLSLQLPRMAPIQQVGETHMIEQPHLALGDILPTRHIMDADMPTALAWLEIMARLGYLRRNEGWGRLFDRLLDDRDRHGVWHPPRSVTMPDNVPDWVWPTMPLSDRQAEADDYAVDVTFRLGLIAKLAGRPIELI